MKTSALLLPAMALLFAFTATSCSNSGSSNSAQRGVFSVGKDSPKSTNLDHGSLTTTSTPVVPVYPMNGERELTPKHPGQKLPKNRPIFSIPSAEADGMVAITMDVETTGKISELLDALKENGIKMTFFLCATWAARHQDLMKRMADEGHEFGNHTMTHPWLTRKTVKQIQEELNGLEKIVHDATGKTTKPYFRPPYGAQNATVNKTASDLGWHDIMWNATAADAQFPRPTKDRVKGLIMALRPGSIYLCHSFVDTSVTALIESLPALKKKGIKVVRLSDLLEQHMKAVEAAELTKRNKGNTPKNFGQPSAAAPPKATR